MTSEQDTKSDARKHWDLCHNIIEVFYAVYSELGYGFLENVYEEAIDIALKAAGFNVSREVETPIWFRGRKIGDYRADIVVNRLILIELKAARATDSSHRATDFEVAQLLNFGPRPSFKHLILENNLKGVRVASRAPSH